MAPTSDQERYDNDRTTPEPIANTGHIMGSETGAMCLCAGGLVSAIGAAYCVPFRGARSIGLEARGRQPGGSRA